MNDMTKEFYTKFLSYISSKELKKLYSNLCRKKISVNGFQANKTSANAVIAIKLAPEIVKKERVFFDVLEEFYTPVYDSRSEAANSFTPDTAVTCLTYFVKSKMADTDEDFIVSLMEGKEIPTEKIQIVPETEKSKKKAEEFREKYLSTRRELIQISSDYTKLQKEKELLKSELYERNNELDRVRETLHALEEESSIAVDQLKEYIKKLEKKISEYQLANAVQAIPVLLIMDTEEFNGLGVDTITYDNVSKLIELAGEYDEILLVINDLPFATKRKIQKIDALQKKIVTFSTKQEMLEYVKRRRNR